MVIWTADTPYVCNWSFDDDWCVPCKNKIPGENATPEQIAMWQGCVDMAAEILYALSGRQYGLCEVSVRPCRKKGCDPCSGSPGPPWTPLLRDGQWTNVRCTQGHDSCSCSEICEVDLPGPVDSIVQVLLDGEVLPASAYRVDNRNSLVALKRPMPLTGDFMVAFAGLDPSATVAVDPPATEVVTGVDLGGGVYGPAVDAPFVGIIRLVWRDIDCVNITYDGPADTAIATTRPAPNPNVAGDTWDWPAPGFNFAVGVPVTSSDANADGSSVVATLVSGTAVSSNANPPPLARNITISPGTELRFCPSQLEQFCWPACQDMNADTSQPNTWEVTYLRGYPVPMAGRRALAQLACELCLACMNDDCCSLPQRVTSIVREGVSMTMLDPMDFIDKGLTGLYAVDMWLRSVNPNARPRGAAILSPDMPSPRRTTWEA